MKKYLLIYTLFVIIACKNNNTSKSSNYSNDQSKENYLASEAEKAIEYNKVHKKELDKKKEKFRKDEEKKLNELNHKKHEPIQKKKQEEGQFKMF